MEVEPAELVGTPLACAKARMALGKGVSAPTLARLDASYAILGGFFEALGPELVVGCLLRFLVRPGHEHARQQLAAALMELLQEQLVTLTMTVLEESARTHDADQPRTL